MFQLGLKYKRKVVFLEEGDELKLRRSREKRSKTFRRIENQVLVERPSIEEGLVR